MFDFCKTCDCNSSRDCATEAQDLKASLDGQAEHWGAVRAQFLGHLNSVVEELAKLPGGRTLILVSGGNLLPTAIPRVLRGGRGFSAQGSAIQDGWPTHPPAWLEAVIKVAVERNVRIYSVDRAVSGRVPCRPADRWMQALLPTARRPA